MRSGHMRARKIAEQDRQTIRRSDGAHHADLVRPGAIRLERFGRHHPRDPHDMRAMDLSQPMGHRGQSQCLGQESTVRNHGRRIVADMIAKVKAGVRSGAHAAEAGGNHRLHRARRRPVGHDQRHRSTLDQARNDPAHETGPRRSVSIKACMSAGGGTSQCISRPSLGCTRPRRAACNA